ncbi:hypothetical protein [Arthrobacter globiformis]|uniref:hypothetical protein n=1 Tax=Arthrobacter globiformis TaxID=1665 RepID=UPI00279004D9|nr:hypothetical protein [Arthrobacter globiformis]MDQ0616737.1 hypothetical protein [Arthrobacter globiformis]
MPDCPRSRSWQGTPKSYAERLFKFPKIGSLDFEDAKKALAEPAHLEGAHFNDDALARAFDLTEGYPYFVQELGYQVWAVADGDVITLDDVEDAKDAYEAKLDSSFFRVRLDRATQLQIAYMRAMAQLGPDSQKAADVAAVMGGIHPAGTHPVRADQHGAAVHPVPRLRGIHRAPFRPFHAPGRAGTGRTTGSKKTCQAEKVGACGSRCRSAHRRAPVFYRPGGPAQPVRTAG